MPEKLFVLVRRDLPPAKRAVQACHAVAEFVQLYGFSSVWEKRVAAIDWVSKYKTLIILKATEQELEFESVKLKSNVTLYAAFREPDMGNSITAIAVLPNDPSYFKRWELDDGK